MRPLPIMLKRGSMCLKSFDTPDLMGRKAAAHGATKLELLLGAKKLQAFPLQCDSHRELRANNLAWEVEMPVTRCALHPWWIRKCH